MYMMTHFYHFQVGTIYMGNRQMIYFKMSFPNQKSGTNKLLISYIVASLFETLNCRRVFMTKFNTMYVLLRARFYRTKKQYMISENVAWSQTSRAEALNTI